MWGNISRFPALVLGADSSATTLTDNTNKLTRVSAAHYDNDEEPMGIVFANAQSTNNNLLIGGGTSLQNAATRIAFYTAANNTTVTGTERVRISSSGDLQMGGANTVIDANRLQRLRSYTVATLPTVGTAGRLAYVTDANSPTYNATVAGSGSSVILVFDNGTNWTCH